jgi:hypothetical protein
MHHLCSILPRPPAWRKVSAACCPQPEAAAAHQQVESGHTRGKVELAVP